MKFIWKSSGHQSMAVVAASVFASTSAAFSASGCLFTDVSRENIPEFAAVNESVKLIVS